MLDKQFIPYKEALILKELGFDEYTFGIFVVGETLVLHGHAADAAFGLSLEPEKELFNAPLYQQAFDWFRTEHKLKFYIREDKWNHWCTPKILIHETEDYEEICDSYPTYEEAQIACLNALINIVKKK